MGGVLRPADSGGHRSLRPRGRTEFLVGQAAGLAGDPWEAFAGTLRRNAALAATDAAAQDAIMRAEVDRAAAEEVLDELMATFAVTVQRAQAAGVVRPDFTVEEVPMLMCGVCSTMAPGHVRGNWDWRRRLELVLDGIRARP